MNPAPQDQLSRDLASLKIDRGAKPPGKGRAIALWLAGFAGAAAAVYFVAYPKLRASLTTTQVRTGEIAMVSPSQGQVQITATGYVIAEVAAKVAAKVPGRIAELYVKEGERIEKGQRVARLEDVDGRSGLAASRARAAAARSRIQIARATLAETRVQLEREQPLVDKGVTAKATLDDLQARAASLTASVRSAEAEAAAADAEAASLETQLGSYVITTPISGTVIGKLVEVGEGVSPGFGTPGVLDVVDLDSLVVEVDVPEVRLSMLGTGNPCEVVLDAYPTERYDCAVKEIRRRINRAKATVPVKVELTGKRPPQLLPEMAARVMFLSARPDPTLRDVSLKRVVPAGAVTQRGGADVVFIYDDERVRMTAVKVGAELGAGRVLETEIPAGTKVVLDPPADMQDGQKVKERS
ncbi:MAG TPA: efflux RND transporter periplasmic adaptor subunit [Kofleriaceae bacterium]|nr:efflux RND transporter periplasmic adaptor subunit [Kofleriaceae bacterium]